MRLLLLAGNSSLRYALAEGTELRESARFLWDDLERRDFAPLREAVERAAPEDAVSGSVRDDLLERLLGALGGSLPPPRRAGRDFDLPIENRYDDPSEVGVDRLLNAVAAHRLWPGAHVAVLDFGSALSVSVVSPEGAFLGGLIGIGGRAAARAVRLETPRLPEVEVEPESRFLHRSTARGLRAGLFWQLAGGAQRIIDGLRAELPEPLVFAATGGGAPLFTGALRGLDHHVPDLTLRGLLFAAPPPAR